MLEERVAAADTVPVLSCADVGTRTPEQQYFALFRSTRVQIKVLGNYSGTPLGRCPRLGEARRRW